MKPSFLLPIVVLLLSGCGFHLAGTRPLPPSLQSVFIDSSQKYQTSEPPVESALRALLQRRGAQVLDRAEAAEVVIRLSGYGESRQLLSVGIDGKALEYQITSQVHYSVVGKHRALLPPDTISLTRSYSYNPQTALAEEIKEERLRDHLQSELADLLLLRLEARLHPAADAPAESPDAAPRS